MRIKKVLITSKSIAAALPYVKEAAAFLSECGVRTHSLKQEKEKKDIFTHIEWRMRAFRAEAAETDEEKLGNSGCFFADEEEIRKDYALPGAFRKWDFFE